MLEENNIFIEVDFMYKKIITLLIIIQIFIFYFIYEQNTMETITYFPKDPHVTMAEASSVVELHNNKLQINVQSKTNTPVQLRQDVFIVFIHMYVKGIGNIWKENIDELTLKQSISITKNSTIDVLSYHYGEVVREETFTSIGKMSSTSSFFDGDTIRNRTTSNDEQIKKKYMHKMNSILQKLQINPSLYHTFPLIDLPLYEHIPFPNMNQHDTDMIIGHLWEGLYKNYIIPMTEMKNLEKSLMPLILIDKNKEHLLVVYTLNGKEKILRQNLHPN